MRKFNSDSNTIYNIPPYQRRRLSQAMIARLRISRKQTATAYFLAEDHLLIEVD